jgi:hypothetical protein
MTNYKWLRGDFSGPYTGFDFRSYLPVNGQPGPFLPDVEEVMECETGWHYCLPDNVALWIEGCLVEWEPRGQCMNYKDKSVSRGGRIVRVITAWTPVVMAEFAAECSARHPEAAEWAEAARSAAALAAWADAARAPTCAAEWVDTAASAAYAAADTAARAATCTASLNAAVIAAAWAAEIRLQSRRILELCCEITN